MRVSSSGTSDSFALHLRWVTSVIHAPLPLWCVGRPGLYVIPYLVASHTINHLLVPLHRFLSNSRPVQSIASSKHSPSHLHPQCNSNSILLTIITYSHRYMHYVAQYQRNKTLIFFSLCILIRPPFPTSRQTNTKPGGVQDEPTSSNTRRKISGLE